MSQPGGVVAVDVGNSAVKLCVRGRQDQVSQHAVALTDPDWTASAMQWAARQLGEDSPVQWRIASVHRGAAERLREAIESLGPTRSIWLVTWRQVPLPIHVDHPDRLGIDRLLGAWGAVGEFAGPLAVVDVGSAITVDWVGRQQGFLGGAILPGVAMQTQSLAAGTDALPNVLWDRHEDLAVPAKNTVDAIRLGVLAGVAGAVDRLVDLYAAAEKVGADCQVVLTGGAAPAIASYLKHPHAYRPHLVGRGLLDLPQ